MRGNETHRRPLVVAYHTGGEYAEEAERLAASLDRLAIPHEIEQMPVAGGWRANAHIRPEFLLAKRYQHPTRPLLSLDADCVVHSDPFDFLAAMDCDVAIHRLRGREVLPGTLWLASGDGLVDEFLREWQSQNHLHPANDDRVNCLAAIETTTGLRAADLPPEYAFIFDTFRTLHPGVEPVIEHFQASRRLKQLMDLRAR